MISVLIGGSVPEKRIWKIMTDMDSAYRETLEFFVPRNAQLTEYTRWYNGESTIFSRIPDIDYMVFMPNIVKMVLNMETIDLDIRIVPCDKSDADAYGVLMSKNIKLSNHLEEIKEIKFIETL